jgi:hypothetical protein
MPGLLDAPFHDKLPAMRRGLPGWPLGQSAGHPPVRPKFSFGIRQREKVPWNFLRLGETWRRRLRPARKNEVVLSASPGVHRGKVAVLCFLGHSSSPSKASCLAPRSCRGCCSARWGDLRTLPYSRSSPRAPRRPHGARLAPRSFTTCQAHFTPFHPPVNPKSSFGFRQPQKVPRKSLRLRGPQASGRAQAHQNEVVLSQTPRVHLGKVLVPCFHRDRVYPHRAE